MSNLSPAQQAMSDAFDQHVAAELAGDLEGTMATMVNDPYVNHVPTLMGGVGYDGTCAFYQNHLVGKFFPPDVEMIDVSRTIDEHRIVDESVIRFTHTVAMDWMLPGVPPTGRPVEVAVVVIVKMADGKVVHEHIYWDQATVLVQLGLLESGDLPVSGAESARKVLDPRLPPRIL